MKKTKRDSTWNFLLYPTLLLFIFSQSCNTANKTVAPPKSTSVKKIKVWADSISRPAYSIPEFKTAPHTLASEGNQIFAVVRTVFQDKSGNLWFGGQGGLSRYDGTSLVYFDLKDDFNKSITVKTIVQDKFNNIWIGHSGGITKYDGTYFTSFSEKDGLLSNDVWSLTTDSKGTVWIGTLKGVNYFNGEVFTPFNIPEAKPDYTRGITSSKIVHCIMQDSKGNIWFGTNGGAYVYNQKTLDNISEKEGLCNNAVNDIIEDKNGNIWFATTHNGICLFDGKSFIHMEENSIVQGKEVGSILEDHNGNIWFTAKGFGVYRYDGNTFTNFHEEEGLNHLTFQIYEDQKEQLWFVGFKGAFRYDGKSIVNVSKAGPWTK
ncbi:two-component regulator propeller domain-containing protein [Ascidiimonas sp. W6]|uniref:ligand-binding sensor domain-containing protein n=1 Tax=Ascidiimonas meishanensis TaxID=3128903 RepID=UPI0030EBAC21